MTNKTDHEKIIKLINELDKAITNSLCLIDSSTGNGSVNDGQNSITDVRDVVKLEQGLSLIRGVIHSRYDKLTN